MNKGIPQGAILSPLLYSIYTNKIESCIKDMSVDILQYADDIIIYSKHKNKNVALNNIQMAINKLINVFTELKMSLSTEKTKFTVFTRHRIPSQFYNYFYSK